MPQMSLYQNFIYKSKYSKFLMDEQRREEIEETATRYLSFMAGHLKSSLGFTMPAALMKELHSGIINLEVMPSMRALMTAGPALERCATVAYNCSYIAIDRISAFDEVMYLLMGGSGVGFSCEDRYISQLPSVPERLDDSDITIRVEDTRAGWAKAFRELLGLLYGGTVPKYDTSKVRLKGALLKTMGGRASGPQPLIDVFEFTIDVFKGAVGRRLRSIEVHDIVCKIGDIVVSGGVRQSAEISLSDLNDPLMRDAKSGDWYRAAPWRQLANNSAVYKDKPALSVFMREWLSLYESQSGERGIFNRNAAQAKAKEGGRRDWDQPFGTNPCGEINLRSAGFCNLTELVVREHDTPKDLARKVKLATILGTFQSTLLHFKYVSARWLKNAAEERLLGVSMTGIMDNSLTSGQEGMVALTSTLKHLREVAVETNKAWAKKLGIPQSAAVTCVKPSGTVSQMVDSASGIHPRYSPYYIRTTRGSKTEPIYRFMVDQGFAHEDHDTKPNDMWVFSFPVKSPEHAVMRSDLTALQHLEVWHNYYKNWCEHNASITVNLKEQEWLTAGAWVYQHIDSICGVSFLPYFAEDHRYRQLPYSECSKEKYEEALAKQPKSIDWSQLAKYESEGNAVVSREFACTGDKCELA